MMLQVYLAHHRGHHQGVVAFLPEARKRDRAIIYWKWQMLFECERDHLMQAARILERQFEQTLGDPIRWQRRDHDIRLTTLRDQPRERAAQIGLVLGAELFVHTGQMERIP